MHANTLEFSVLSNKKKHPFECKNLVEIGAEKGLYTFWIYFSVARISRLYNSYLIMCLSSPLESA